LLYALDEQVRRYEVEGKVQKYEHHEFMRLVIDDEGIARGVVLMNLHTLQLEVLKADAVIVGTGGPGLIFKKSTNSTFCTGAANGRLFMQGMHYANPEFIQVHPTAIPGEDKLRLISESSRGEGGRIWVYGDSSKTIVNSQGETISCGKSKEPWYFLEEMYPAFGNLVPRDIASREILRICEMGLGIEGKNQVYLDVSHLSAATRNKIASVLEIYEKFTGDSPSKVPMKIFPAVHYSMGGAWVDWPSSDDKDRLSRFRQMTNIAGCFQVGESEFAYHGANRLGANSLLSCIFAGLTSALEVKRYTETLKIFARELPSRIFSSALHEEEKNKQELMKRDGKENVHKLHEELSSIMMQHVTVKRSNQGLQEAIRKILEIKERYKNISLDDRGSLLNQTYQFAAQFGPMLEIAHAMALGALQRNESRGAHYKEEFPNRDDKNWLKTTVATYLPSGPVIHYIPVDTRHLHPIARDYSKAVKVKPALENVPQNIELPV
jgi:succinate dehydrogenase / fumarate reductase flavoprotein subunit